MSKSSRASRRKAKSPSDGGEKPFPPVSITEQGVQSPTVANLFTYDEPKYARQHFHDFCDIAGARLYEPAQGKLSLVTGVASSLVVIQIGLNRGSFVPNLKPGKYGVEHTANGNLLTKTKRIVNLQNGTTSIIFGIIRDEWPDGLNSCTLVQPDIEGRGPIRLLADGAEIPIEPTPGYRFYTPFFHNPGAGSGFVGKSDVHPLYHPLGIMTLSRSQLSELLRAFNKDWSNGPVFARKSIDDANRINNIPVRNKGRKRKKKEGLDRWC